MRHREVWSVLGIAETEDEGAIRKAYANRLRQTNPEDDAEGFKTLREAYDAALVQARRARQEREWREQRAAREAARDDDSDPPGDEDDRAEDGWDQDDWYEDDWEGIETDAHGALDRPGLGLSANGLSGADDESTQAGALRAQLRADIEAHNAARTALAEAIRDRAPEARILEALQALLRTHAMGQIDVYVSTAAWLTSVLHQCRPVSDVMVDPVIAFFGWDGVESVGTSSSGTSALGLRNWIRQEKAADAYLARVADRRHEFHRAWLETRRSEAEFTPKAGIARIWALRRLVLIERFLDFTHHKFPSAAGSLDPAAVAWWRAQSSTPGITRSLARHLSGFNILRYTVVVFLIAAAWLAIEHGADNVNDWAQAPPHQLREDCRREARVWMPAAQPGATAESERKRLRRAVQACEHALARIPDSLMVRQYAAIVELRLGERQKALPHAEAILKLSPADPVALYIKGLALDETDTAGGEGRKLMKDALFLDPRVDDRLRAFHVEGLPRIFPSTTEPDLFPPRLLLPIDEQPREGSDGGQEAVDAAYRKLGVTSTEGTAMLECVVRDTGRLEDCRIRSETPWNRGIGELALEVAKSRILVPAKKGGVPVDGVPLLLPYGFKPSAGWEPALAAKGKPPAIDFRDYDEEATGVAENLFARELAEAQRTYQTATIRARLADLNDDGIPEIVAQAGSRALCNGSSHTCFHALKARDGGYEVIASLDKGNRVTILDTKTRGWHDIEAGDVTYRFNGTRY